MHQQDIIIYLLFRIQTHTFIISFHTLSATDAIADLSLKSAAATVAVEPTGVAKPSKENYDDHKFLCSEDNGDEKRNVFL